MTDVIAGTPVSQVPQPTPAAVKLVATRAAPRARGPRWVACRRDGVALRGRLGGTAGPRDRPRQRGPADLAPARGGRTGDRHRQHGAPADETDAYVTALAARVRGQILKAADAWEVDVIAMTTHGRSGLSRLAFGSVAEAVLRRARVPVFVKRVQQTETERSAA